jgi:hypothetical protein
VVPGANEVGLTVVPVEVSTIAFPPPNGVSVVEYPVIVAPPLEDGAVIVIVAAVADVAVAAAILGAPGGAAEVVIVDAAVVPAPSPTAFVALEVIVY